MQIICIVCAIKRIIFEQVKSFVRVVLKERKNFFLLLQKSFEKIGKLFEFKIDSNMSSSSSSQSGRKVNSRRKKGSGDATANNNTSGGNSCSSSVTKPLLGSKSGSSTSQSSKNGRTSTKTSGSGENEEHLCADQTGNDSVDPSKGGLFRPLVVLALPGNSFRKLTVRWPLSSFYWISRSQCTKTSKWLDINLEWKYWFSYLYL